VPFALPGYPLLPLTPQWCLVARFPGFRTAVARLWRNQQLSLGLCQLVGGLSCWPGTVGLVVATGAPGAGWGVFEAVLLLRLWSGDP